MTKNTHLRRHITKKSTGRQKAAAGYFGVIAHLKGKVMILFRKEFYQFWDIEIYLERKPGLFVAYEYYDGPLHAMKIGWILFNAIFIGYEPDDFPNRITQWLFFPVAWCYYRIALWHWKLTEHHNNPLHKDGNRSR